MKTLYLLSLLMAKEPPQHQTHHSESMAPPHFQPHYQYCSESIICPTQRYASSRQVLKYRQSNFQNGHHILG